MIIEYPDNVKREDKMLANYATKASDCRGRVHDEEPDPLRTPFQRDRDRIIHSKAFRRLKGKTQVFVANYGDHYRSRLSHSMEVSQIARDVCRSLGLNEDLAEAVALAHDLGHPPFGHAGEEALDEMMRKHGMRFRHNDQSRHIVERLERKYPDFLGLNLTYEVRHGLMKHYDEKSDGSGEEHLFSLEAQIVDLADEIAYHNHDIDDAVRSGVLTVKKLRRLAIWKEAVSDVSTKLDDDLYLQTALRNLMAMMVSDLTFETEEQIQAKKIQDLNDVWADRNIATFSHDLRKNIDELAEFLGENFYFHERVYSQAVRGQQAIKDLYKLFSTKDKLLPIDVRQRIEKESIHVVIKDYIAGMTDSFAQELHRNYFS